jgi:hypothetical protein
MTAAHADAVNAPAPWAVVAVMAGFLGLVLAYWFFCRFSYEITEDVLEVRRYILRWVPIGRHRVRLSDIVGVESSGLMRVKVGVVVWAPLSARPGLLLTLSRPRYGLWDTVYIAPPDPEGFERALRERMARQRAILSGTEPVRRHPWPLWATDAVVAVAALCLGAWVPVVALADSLPARMGVARFAEVAAALTAGFVPIQLWLLLECLRSIDTRRATRRWLWPAFILALPGAGAVAYYLLEWRPERVRAGLAQRLLP